MQKKRRKKTRTVTSGYGRLLKNHRTMTIFSSVLLLALVIFASSLAITNVVQGRAEAAEVQAAQVAAAEERVRESLREQEKEKARESALASLELVGRGAVIYDINSGSVVFERNADEAFPIASITKVMTIVTASDYLDSDTLVYIDEESINTEGESGLILGELWSFKELSDLTMIISSNDGAVAIAKAAGKEINKKEGQLSGRSDLEVFVEKMNNKAREIGLKNTIFYNPTGLDLNFETEPGAMSTSRDIARLLAYALLEKPDLLKNSSLDRYTATSHYGRSLNIENTNYATRSTPGLLISKTGNTLQAGGTLAIAADIGVMQPVAIVVLGSTIADRVGDVSTLYQAAKLYFENL